MSRPCPRQEEIRGAFLEGPLEEELRSHALFCSDCGQQLMVASALAELNASEPAEPALPQAEYLWFKARMEQRLHQRRRRQRLALWTYGAIAFLLLAVVPLVVLWGLPALGQGSVDDGMRRWTDSLAHWARLGVLTWIGSLLTAILFGAFLRLLGRRLA